MNRSARPFRDGEGPRRPWRRRVRLAGAALGLLALLGAGALGVGSSAWFGRQLASLIERRAAAAGIPLSIESLRLSPLSGWVRAGGLHVEGPAPIERLDVTTVRLRFSRRALVGGRLRVLELEVDSPRLALRQAPSQQARDESMGVEERGLERLLEVFGHLDRIALTGGRLRFDRRDVPFSLEARGVVMTGGVRRAAGLHGRVEIASVVLEIAGRRPVVCRPAPSTWLWDGSRLVVERIAVKADAFQLDGSVTVDLAGAAPRVTARASGPLDLGWLAGGEAPVPVSGRALLTARLSTAATRYEIEGLLERPRQVRVADREIVALTVPFRLADGEFAVIDAAVRTGDGLGLPELDIGWKRGAWSAGGRLEAPLEALLAASGLPADLASGDVTGSFEASGQAEEISAYRLVADIDPGSGPAGLAARVVVSSEQGASLSGEWAGAPIDIAAEWPPDGPVRASWKAAAELNADSGPSSRALVSRVVPLLRALGVAPPSGFAPGARGPAAVRLTASGQGLRVARLALSSRAEGLEHRGRGIGDGEFRLELDVARRRLRAAGRLAAGPAGRGTLFEIASSGTGGYRLALLFDRAPLEWWQEFEALLGLELSPEPLTGTASGAVRGELDSAGASLDLALRAEGRAGGTGVSWPGVEGWTSGKIEPGGLHLRGFGLQAAPGRFAGRAAIFWPDPANGWSAPGVSARGEGRLDFGRAVLPLGVPWPTDGILMLRGGAEWRQGDAVPRIDSEVAWRGLRRPGFGLPDGELRLEGGGGRIHVLGESGGLSVGGSVRAVEGRPVMALVAQAREIDVGALAGTIARRAPLAVAAWMPATGRLSLEGPLLDPGAWQGSLALDALLLEAPGYRVRLARPARLQVVPGGSLRIPEAAPIQLEGQAGERLSIGGRIGWYGDSAGEAFLSVRGAADLSLAEALDPDLIARGAVRLDLRLEGPLLSPRWNGEVTVDDARVRHLGMRETLDDLRLRALLSGRHVSVEGTARLGGGLVRLSGPLELEGWFPRSLDLAAGLEDVGVNTGHDLWARWNGELRLAGPFDRPLVSGSLEMIDGRYTADLPLVVSPWRRVRAVEPGWGPGTLPDRLRLDVDVRSDYVLSIVNDQADLVAALDLRAEGRLAAPLLSGTVTLLEGGRVRFRGIEYEVLAGQVILDQRHAGVTRLRLRATTDVAGYRIELELDASERRVDYRLRSLPALSEPDILSLLLTGQRASETGNLSALGSDVAATYFGSSLGELLLAPAARRLLGLSEFRLGTARIGPEARPTARLTLGRRLDDRTLLLYSRDLSSEGRDLYRLERELSRTLRAAVGRESLGGVSAELRWIERLGERDERTGARREERLARVELPGWPADIDRPSRRDLGLRRGVRVTRSLSLRTAERARRLLVAAGYLEAEVRPRIVEEPGARRVRLRLDVEPGPRWRLETRGSGEPRRLVVDALADLWAGTRFRADAFDEAERVAVERLADEGWATALVTIEREAADARVVRVEIDPGPRVVLEEVELEGVRSLPVADVRAQLLARPGRLGLRRVLYRPRAVADDAAAIEALYVAHGYLDVRVAPRVRLSPDGRRARVTYVVDEGRRYVFAAPRIEGNWPERLGPATRDLPVDAGSPFAPDRLAEATAELRRRLDEAGYYQARIDVETGIGDGTVLPVFRVAAGEPAIIGAIDVRGLRRTRPKIVQRALAFEVGQPLTSRRLAETERRLFRLGVFRRAAIRVEPMPDSPGSQRVIVELEELPPVSFLGSIGWDTEEKLRVSGALSHENMFGRARIGSLQGFGSSLRRGLRATLEDRHLLGGRLEGLLATGGEVEERDGFTLRTLNVAAELATPERRKRRWVLRYQIDRTRVSDVFLDTAALAERLQNEGIPRNAEWLAGVIGAFIVDRRDDPFLPQAGWLGRTETGLWLGAFGSDASFVRWSGQLAGYQPLGRSVTLAGSIRLGASWTLGGTASVPVSQRFFAGGSDTVRGYSRDALGPEDPLTGLVLGGGGEAEWINNIELRWRLTPQFDVALFHDSGNVWATAGQLDPSDLRQTIGLGFRWRSPVGLLRLEYGRKLDRRPDESRGELFIAIGEAW